MCVLSVSVHDRNVCVTDKAIKFLISRMEIFSWT
jgi:hypothetical protein